jgi:hypothetical protein
MMTDIPEVITLGDLVAAAFDAAAHYSSDPKEVSRLATQTVVHMLRANSARNIGSTSSIDFIEKGVVQRETSLRRSTKRPRLGP